MSLLNPLDLCTATASGIEQWGAAGEVVNFHSITFSSNCLEGNTILCNLGVETSGFIIYW